MRRFFGIVLLSVLLIIFHTSVYAQKGKHLLFSEQGRDYIRGSHLPQNYAPHGFVTRTHTNHMQEYYMHYPSAELSKKQIDYSHTKYVVFAHSYYIFDTNVLADKYMKYWNKCPKNPYAHRNAQPGQAVSYDHPCLELSIGDFSYVDFLHTNAIKVQTRTGRLVTQIMISSRPDKAKKYPYEILSPAPSDKDLIAIVPQWHNAILNYAKDNGWKIGTYKPNLDKDKNLDSDILEQPITIPKTNLSANAGVSANTQTQETVPQTTYDPCKDPNQDAAMKEYCANKAYNAKLDREEEADDKAREKAWEEEDKKEEAHQKMLDDWFEEDRQANIKHNKELEKGNKKREDAEKQENQAFHDKIANEQKERKAKQAEIKKAHDIVDRFGEGDPESRRLSHKKIDEFSKNADSEKATKIKNATRKQYYDSKQIKLQGEAEYQTTKAKEIDKKGKYVKGIKDTSLTINKVLAKLDPTGTGDKIVSAMEHTYTAIEGHEKGGWGGAVDNLIEKKASELSGGWSDVAKEEIETYKKYQKGGSITLKKHEHYYDKDKNRLTKVKKGQKLYDENDNEITFSFEKRIFKNTVTKLNDDYNSISTAATKIEEIKEGVVTGDFNKVVNAGLDTMDAKDSIDGGTDKIIKGTGQ